MALKVVITFLTSIILSVNTYSQNMFKESEKIATFCKLWGFLKYYHPEVAKGKLDWDKEFTNRINEVLSLNSKEEINNYYAGWINSLGTVAFCKKCNNEIPDSLKFNLDLAWLNDSITFAKTVINQLEFIRNNRNQGRNYYVRNYWFAGNTEYNHEKPYKDSVFPSPELRLLGLSRYWNIINYFYPYKYLIGEDWNQVLVEMIPKFKDSKDTISYHLAMLELTSRINDSHTRFVTKYTNQYFGLKWAPFSFQIIDNKVLVTGLYNDSLCRIKDIRLGDVFLKIGDLTIEELIKERSKYIGASNEVTKRRNMYYAIFNGQSDSVNTTFERNGIIATKTINRYYFWKFNYKWVGNLENNTCKILDGNIGYLNLGMLRIKQTKEYLNKLKYTKAIIIDVRNYPNGTLYRLSKFLNKRNKPFAKFTYPVLTYPGVYHYTKPYTCGRKNKSPYAGKVVLLFNEWTQSHAEFTLMALQTAPNVISIGSQTAGADGNVSKFKFPGNYITSISGIGVYYPDGRETQRVGIIPDIEIKPTIEGITLNRDEVLDKAIEIINSK